jgi:oligopeptide/dipeptide ABC transporter ATP-binding protein
VCLEIARSSTLSVVGESGCGKTTLGRCVVGLLEPTDGEIRFAGRNVGMLARRRDRDLRRRVQIVFQNPDATLNPQKTVEQTLRRPLELFNIATGPELEQRIVDLLRAVHLSESHRQRYPHQLSGGEKQRVAIARAFATEPELIICDEPLSSLDVSVQSAILNLLVNLQSDSHVTYLFISHDLSVVRYLSTQIMVMYLGKICETRPVDELLQPPYHPYTEALLSAVSVPDPAVRQRKVRLEGPVPSPLNPGPGCRFHTRCPRKAGEICEREPPPLIEVDVGHVIYCHIPLEELRRVPLVLQYPEVDD